ncbi:hypothetical protein ACFLZ1_01320 [Patescibacteria group bacterium]
MSTRKILIGVICGMVAGIIDVVPMVFQKLTWDANFSAFTMWIVVGFFLSTTSLKVNGVTKGIIFSFLVLSPSAILIGWSSPLSLLPIFIMTLILGGLLGLIVDMLTKK